MARVVIVGSNLRSFVANRGPLVQELAAAGHEVHGLIPLAANETVPDLPAQVHRLPLAKHGTNPIDDWKYAQALKALFREIKPDVVLSYNIKPVIYGSLMARKAGVKRVVSMMTGLGYLFAGESLKRKLMLATVRPLYKKALIACDLVIFQNEDDRNDLLHAKLLAVDKAHLLINGSGVDVNHFAYAEPKGTPGDELTFLMISRLSVDKGVAEFMEASKMLRREYPKCKFRLLGGYDPSLPHSVPEADRQRWIDEGVVEFLAHVPDVRQNVVDCDVVVLSSYREGTPRSILEALSMGRPCVTTDAPGCRQTIEHGVQGRLVPVKDAAGLAEGMRWFVQSSDRIPEMSRAARQRAIDKYSVTEVNRNVIRGLGL